MAFNQASPHQQHLDLNSSTQPVEKPSNDHSEGEDSQYTHPPETETPDQRPINLSYIQSQRNVYQFEVIGTPFDLPFTDTASTFTAVCQPSPVKQHQLITVQPSCHPDPIATPHVQLPLTAVLINQQQPATELHYIQDPDYSATKLPPAHDQATPRPTSKQNRGAPFEHFDAH